MTLGEKDPKKANKTILLVGETGTGKSTLINVLVNYAVGVKWEDGIWFDMVGQYESQTADVIVYQIFGFEGRTLPFSLTIIDTLGYGIHEISVVGLVVKASVNRLSDRLWYIFDSVMSLFGNDVENNTVALITHSNGQLPRNALKALEAAEIKCAKDENNQIVHFLFDNCQLEDRKEDNKMQTFAKGTSTKGLTQFAVFLSKIKPQKLKITIVVLNECMRLAACIQNLKERITFIELKQKETQNIKLALANVEEQMKKNAVLL